MTITNNTRELGYAAFLNRGIDVFQIIQVQSRNRQIVYSASTSSLLRHDMLPELDKRTTKAVTLRKVRAVTRCITVQRPLVHLLCLA
jgi:hypothetical protein